MVRATRAGSSVTGWCGLVGRCRSARQPTNPMRVPVWAPYPRGERVPLDDTDRRAVLDGLDLTHGPAAVMQRSRRGVGVRRPPRHRRRARAYAGVEPSSHRRQRRRHTRRRVGAGAWPTRPGCRSSASRWPTAPRSVRHGSPESPPGSEDPMAMTDARRWARTGRRFEPRAAWAEPMAGRYERFLALSRTGGRVTTSPG